MDTNKAAATPAGGGPRRVIKRYSNRKLYDTRDSRYVTLQQIGEMVRAGEEVQIIDNKTKEDKTEVTLALILSEGLKSEPRSVPLGALRDLIQERGEKLWSQLREGPIGRLIPGAAADGDVAEEPAQAIEEKPETVADGHAQRRGRLSELMGSSLSGFDERIRAIVPSARSFSELKEEVQRLSERIEALERQISAQKSQGPDQKTTKR
jgi:polyhydroxyalkanoate synthesis repressor PhaR